MLCGGLVFTLVSKKYGVAQDDDKWGSGGVCV
jgi:hypothetical protein